MRCQWIILSVVKQSKLTLCGNLVTAHSHNAYKKRKKLMKMILINSNIASWNWFFLIVQGPRAAVLLLHCVTRRSQLSQSGCTLGTWMHSRLMHMRFVWWRLLQLISMQMHPAGGASGAMDEPLLKASRDVHRLLIGPRAAERDP